MKIETEIQKFDLRQLDCYYADLRLEEEAVTELGFKNGKLEQFSPKESLGAFLRVYNRGKWFYKAITDFKLIEAGFAELIAQSKNFSGECSDLFSAVPPGHEEFLRFADRDPRRVSLREKRALAEAYLEFGRDVPQLKELNIFYKDRYQKRAFRSSRGRSFTYDYADYGMSLLYTLREDAHFFKDIYRLWGQDTRALAGHQRAAREYLEVSLKHLKAPTIKPGKYTVMMDSEMVGVFTHESFGHKSEADFMLGDQAAKNEWKIGTKVAADCVSIVDYGGEIDNSGYCPIDDEGVIKEKTYLIKNGVLQGRLHSLATAAEFGERPTGNARAISFEFEPIVRMTNTYIEAGHKTEAELMAGVKEGLYLTDVRHGSGLSTFTIAPIKAYWIRDGKLAEPVKVPVVSGTVFDTLNKISGVAKSVGIQSSAFGGCGKDEQFPLRVADGGPVILIDEMQVG